MRYSDKRSTKELLLVIGRAIESLETSFDQVILGEVLNSLGLVQATLQQEENPPAVTIRRIDELSALLRISPPTDAHHAIQDLYHQVMAGFDEEVVGKVKVAFLPYKASMWDSLESIYFAAARDPMCDASVVPIPYHILADDRIEPCYEGNLFPPNIPITHYSSYDLATERPDIIFVHNIYDQYNTVTRVYEEYFTSNLRKYTDLLVYVPYCLFSFTAPQPGDASLGIAFGLPSMKNVDKVVVQGRHFRDAALALGLPEDKILALGSPKIDRIVTALENGVDLPKDWVQKVRGKIVFLYDTHMLFLSSGNIFERLEQLVKILNTPNFVEGSVLIWRPHPLLRVAIKHPLCLDYYLDLVARMGKNEYENVIFDDNADFMPALAAADVYIGRSSSLLNAFMLKGKPVILVSAFRSQSYVKSGLFHSLVDGSSSWITVMRDAAKESAYQDLRKVRLARDAWYNVDGTSGEKIYELAKEQALRVSGDS